VRGEETVTQALHRLTSYEAGRDWTEPVADDRIVQDLQVNDLERIPWAYKRYDADLPGHALPPTFPATTAPVLAVLAGTARPAEEGLDLARLAQMLFLSAGVVRTAEARGRTILFRAAGSAGARFPLELYAAVPPGSAVPAGVHWYHPEQHALLTVGPAPAGTAPAIVVTGVPWRTGWRYRERGYRHLYWDAGTMLAQLLAVGLSFGLDPRLVTRFPDATVDALVGADGIHEFALAVVALGSTTAELAPSGSAARGRVDASPLEFPLVSAAQQAGRRRAWGNAWPDGEAAAVPETGPTVDEVVLRRSSQRRMDPTRGLPRSVLTASMAVATRGIHVPHWVVVHDVEGVASGVYRWPELASPLRTGALRQELYHVALDQGLPRDAAFVVVSATRTAALDDRAYREAQLAAGLVTGRLHLAAYAQGASASGMTFLDSEIPTLLGEPLDGLLFTCVGVPDNTSKAGGPPGNPTPVRPVSPRVDDS
jgi:SagB-type dehydrogenase family enzyme